jgi:hypothetical protein
MAEGQFRLGYPNSNKAEAENIVKGPLECTDYEGRVMKQTVIFLMILTLGGPLAVFAATLQNTDSQEYELQIQESGRPYGSQYRMIEHAKVDICFNGCEMTLLSTGQTVRINPNDAVVISNRIMNVHRAVNERGAW